MIDKIKTLLNKTSELENNITALSNSQNTFSSQNCLTISKAFLNHSIASKSKVHITNIEVSKGSQLYFQMIIDLNLQVQEKVSVVILVNDIAISKSTRTLSAGFNQITLVKNYTPLESGEIRIDIEITPQNSKQIFLTNTNLLIWGLEKPIETIQYQTLEYNDYYLITFISNNYLYYKFVSKQTNSYSQEDFAEFKSAKSYSFVYHNNVLFLFRVDKNGNLFACDFDNKNENFLTNNVSWVSAASGNNNILISVIKNGACFYFEFDNFSKSIEKHLNCNNITFSKCLCFYNNKTSRYFIIISNNDSNYIVESVEENGLFNGHINANFDLKINIKE